MTNYGTIKDYLTTRPETPGIPDKKPEKKQARKSAAVKRFTPSTMPPRVKRLAAAEVLRCRDGSVAQWGILLDTGQYFSGRCLQHFWSALFTVAREFDMLAVTDLNAFAISSFFLPYGFPNAATPTLKKGGSVLAWNIRAQKGKLKRKIFGLSSHLKKKLDTLPNLRDWLPRLLDPLEGQRPLAYDAETYQPKDLVTHERCCKNRCYDIIRIANELQSVYLSLGTEIKTSSGASIMQLFKCRYLPRFKNNYWFDIPDHTREYMRKAYFGGRCEVFTTAKTYGRIYSIDRRSAYGAVMASLKLPLPVVSWSTTRLTKIRRIWRRWPGVVTAVVVVPDYFKFAPLPVRDERTKKVSYPVGLLTGTWCTNELAYAEKVGCTVVEITDGIVWQNADYYLKDIARAIFSMRYTHKSWLSVAMGKRALTALSGKWAQRNGRTVEMHRKKEQMKDPGNICEYWPSRQDKVFILEHVPGETFPMHSNIIWSAMINAQQRIELHQELTNYDRYPGQRVLYCATDGFYVKVPGEPTTELKQEYQKAAKHLGEWVIKGVAGSFQALAPNVYTFGDEVKCAGFAEIENMAAFLGNAVERERAKSLAWLIATGNTQDFRDYEKASISGIKKPVGMVSGRIIRGFETFPKLIGDPNEIVKVMQKLFDDKRSRILSTCTSLHNGA